MGVQFTWCDGWNSLLGVHMLNGISENMETGEQKEEYILSFGFLLFTIDLIF
jgi:hypothetical protein